MMDSQALIIDSEIVNSVTDWNGGCNIPLFLSQTKTDNEITAIFLAWMMNGWKGETQFALSYINDVLTPTPTEFVLNYPLDDDRQENTKSFFRLLTHDSFVNLIAKLQYIIQNFGCVENLFNIRMAFNRKTKNTHVAFAEMLGCNTMLPTLLSNCTFYRYNLMYYLLAYKSATWDRIYMKRALLPCCDKTFERAYRLGIVKKPMKSTLENTMLLTNIAKANFGENFYLLYEYLNDENQ